MPYSIPAVGAEGDPGFLAWASSMRTSLLDLETRVLELEGGSGFVGPFDAFATPHRAHSLRRLLSAYTGPAVRVRRSTDNVEFDIGFTSEGALDTTELLAQIGSASAYVVTWYDQSGNNRHVAQTTTPAQPRLVNAGVVDVSGSLPAVRLDGTDDYLFSTTTGLFAAGAATIAAVLQSGSATMANAPVIAESMTSTNSGNWRPFRTSNANWNSMATGNTGTSWWASTITGSNLFDTNRHQAFYAEASALINSWRDGVAAHVDVAAARTAGGSITPDRFTLGAAYGSTIVNFYNGFLQEVVAWASNETTDRAAVSADQKAYWGTP